MPMIGEQWKAFIAKVRVESNLQEKLKAAANPVAVVVIEHEAGFCISGDELMKAQS